MTTKGVIARVASGSIAEEMELVPGDKIVAVDGKPISDIIELSFALADEYVEITVEKKNGEQEICGIEKEYDEELGIEFESAVFDRVKPCANKCLFCFVDQMPTGMRNSLYIKDDDFRLSFLYGNFITLTNTSAKDFNRIKKLHLSPLYISVHTTDGELRSRMLGSQRAKDILEQLGKLSSYGIEMHTQIVLCPGWNDGGALERTISDLYALSPSILSLAIVPVGLTKYRQTCQPLEPFSLEAVNKVIQQVSAWQKRCRKETGNNFVYLADEFYLAAGQDIPAFDEYDGFPQLENGVGLVRSFLTDWQEQTVKASGYDQQLCLDVVCGISAAKILEPLLTSLQIRNLKIRLVPVENSFFGRGVTVTGLLTGNDIADTLARLPDGRDGIVLPGIALRKGEDIFLDGITVNDISSRLGVKAKVAYSAADLWNLLWSWR